MYCLTAIEQLRPVHEIYISGDIPKSGFQRIVPKKLARYKLLEIDLVDPRPMHHH